MAELRRTVAYEVYIKRQTRWELYSRFEPSERDNALRTAKSLDGHSGIQAVKVIREIFDTFAEITEEYIVYKSRSGAPSPRQRSHSARKHRSIPGPRTPQPGAPSSWADPKSAIRFRMRMAARALFATFLALAVAALITAVFAHIFNGGSRFNASSLSGAETASLVAIFSGVFLAISIIAAGQLFPAFEQYLKTMITQSIIFRSLSNRKPKGAPAPSESRPQAPPIPAGPEIPAPDPTDAKAQTKFLKDYLREAVKPVRGAYDVRDQFIRFGINLFTAGACETLCKERGVPAEIAQTVMADVVHALGVNSERSKIFAANYLEYLVSEPRYSKIFDAGREAMLAHQANQPQATNLLCRALDDWVTPDADAANNSRIVTVMFTHIANYDEITAQQGDKTGQEILRAHNGIVESVLGEFGGKQIKQIQNGTMASFSDNTQGVGAAVAIRDRLAEHSKQNPALPIDVKVGLNCGEPITEDNDLFGSTVQLAARIMDQAKIGQVVVSQPICEEVQARTNTLIFESCGTPSLKGFADPVALFAAKAAPSSGAQVPTEALESSF